MNKQKLVRTVAAVLSSVTVGGAGAVDLRPHGVSVQDSRGTRDTRMAGAAVGR